MISNGHWYGLFGFLLFGCWAAIYTPIGDFGNYYYAATFVRLGMFDETLYFPYVFNQKILALSGQHTFLNYTPNTPFLAVFFVPLSWLGITYAKIVFNACGVILFGTAMIQLRKYWGMPKWAIWIIPVVFLGALKNNLFFGQVYFLLLFLIIQGTIFLYHKREWGAAWCWGLAIGIKVLPVILLGYLIFSRRLRALMKVMVVLAVLMLFSIYFTSWKVHVFYVWEVIPRAIRGELAGAYVDQYQSLSMVMKRLLVPHPVENPHVLWNAPEVFYGLNWGIKAAAIIGLAWVTHSHRNLWLNVGLYLFIGLGLLTYSSSYAVILLIPFYAWCASVSGMYRYFGVLGIALLGINYWPGSDFPWSYAKLWVMMALVAGGLFLYANRQVLWGMCVAFFGGIFLGVTYYSSPMVDAYASSFSMPILTYAYRLHDQTISYSYWNGTGDHQNTFVLSVPIEQVEPLPIYNGQVWWKGQPLTRTISNKRDALLINQNQILFLSDEGRGLGFYQLRTKYVDQ